MYRFRSYTTRITDAYVTYVAYMVTDEMWE